MQCCFWDVFYPGSRINSPTNADFIEVCGDQIIRECVVCKTMREIYKAKRREKIETLHLSRVCQDFDFSVETRFE